MIFLHRQNNTSIKPYACEIDVRSSPFGLVMNHDRLDYTKDYPLIADALNTFTQPVILNIKESGIEEELIELFEGKDYYFLDSQIPDIIKLSTKYPHIAHRFIIRISKVEPESILLDHAKYVWVDWNFNNFDLLEYEHFIKNLSLKNAHPIFVSPELYDMKYESLIPKVKQSIDSTFKTKSICTKLTKLWYDYD